MSSALHLPSTDGLDLAEAKQALRAAVNDHRAQRGAKVRQRAAATFAAHGLAAVNGASCVAAYVSMDNEPDSSELLEDLRSAGVRVLLPVLGPGLQRSWAIYRGPQELQIRAPGRPPEPLGEVLDAAELATADAVIAPGLAIDSRATRLGQGGGWYDRALLQRRDGVPVFAMVHEAELIEDAVLPRAEHDVPVTGVITEERWFTLDASGFPDIDGQHNAAS